MGTIVCCRLIFLWENGGENEEKNENEGKTQDDSDENYFGTKPL